MAVYNAHRLNYSLMRGIFSAVQIIIDIYLYNFVFSFMKINIAFEVKAFLTGTMTAFFLFESLYFFRLWTFWDEIKAALRSGLSIFLVSVLFLYTSKIKMSLFALTLGIAIFIPVSLAVRYIFRRVLFSLGLLSTGVIILGAGGAGEIFAQNINLSPFTTRKVLGFLDDDESKRDELIAGVPVLGKLQDFEHIQSQINADEAIIAIPTASRKTLADILNIVEENINRVLYIPDMYMLTTYSAEIRTIDGLPIISASQGLLNPVNRFVKNIFDYIGGFAALILFSPFMLVMAWKIHHDDGGKVLFKHKRVGQNLRPFYLYKFRTMIPNAEQILQEMLKDEKLCAEFQQAFKFKHDPRITKFGKFLRRTSLDELPQIFNVLRGEMSLTGPRPIVDEEIKLYYGYRTAQQIFRVKPGMTGFWQVSGRNDVKDYDERITYDLYYIHNWSVWLDIIILLRTIRAVVRGTGAY